MSAINIILTLFLSINRIFWLIFCMGETLVSLLLIIIIIITIIIIIMGVCVCVFNYHIVVLILSFHKIIFSLNLINILLNL